MRVRTAEYDARRFSASIPGVPFTGEGASELEAVKNLAMAIAEYYRRTNGSK